MQYRKVMWGIGAAALIGLGFGAGVVMSENAAPEKARNVSVGAASTLDDESAGGDVPDVDLAFKIAICPAGSDLADVVGGET